MAQTLRFVVPPESDGVKLKVFLRGRCALSYRLMVSLKHVENGITANGGHIRVIDRVQAGDVIELHIPDDSRPAAPIPDKRFQVLYEDDQGPGAGQAARHGGAPVPGPLRRDPCQRCSRLPGTKGGAGSLSPHQPLGPGIPPAS